jgi:membrane-associated protease RseP (regulator of RpoE activity)
MAGVVKHSGLDMEYLCRRCDSKIDLRDLITRLVEVMGKTTVRQKVEKSLQLALQIMQDTQNGGFGGRILEYLVGITLKKVSADDYTLQKAPQTEFSLNKAVGSAYVLFVASGVVFGCVYHLVF